MGKLARILTSLLLSLILWGCGGTGGKAKATGGTRAVEVEEGTDLAQLARAVKTSEDSLVLDLLLGYRLLLLGHPDPKSLDQETLKRGREAYERLEKALRHGGLRPQEGGERVYSITSEDKLSLQEVLRSASVSAGKSAQAGDWERARARWREIIASKAAVAWIMEEASWGLALADALESDLPEPIKKKLKDVDGSYAREIGQDEIARQVKDLLAETIQDDKLRRELKKLANRAWERDKRAGRPTAPASTPAQAADTAKAAHADFELPAAPPSGTTPGSAPEESAVVGDAEALGRVDTLIAQGKYLPALRALESASAIDGGSAKERRIRIGDRYCEEKRKAAATGFMQFKKAQSDAQRALHLRRTAGDLDSCLFYFPDNGVAQKVRRNREMVEGELKKLKP